MNSKIKDLLLYHLILSAFADSGRCSRLENSSGSMREIVEANPFLREVYTFPYWLSGSAPHEMSGKEYRAFRQVSMPQHFAGSVELHLEELFMIVNTENGIVRMNVNENIKIEHDLNPAETAHVFAYTTMDGLTASVIVSDHLYQATCVFDNDWFRLDMIEQILELDWSKQKTIYRFLDNPKQFLWFLAFLAGNAADTGDHFASNPKLFSAVCEFNRSAASKLNGPTLSAFDAFVFIDLIEAYDIWHDDWSQNKLFRFLVVISLTEKLSPWLRHVSIGSALVDHFQLNHASGLATYLPLLFDDPTQYDVIMEEVLTLSKNQDFSYSTAEVLLWSSLCISAFSASFVSKACDVLFCESITDLHAAQMDELLAGPNGNEVFRYINAEFNRNFSEGVARYQYALAAIENSFAYQRSEDLLRTAISLAMEGKSKRDVLRGLARASLLLWSPAVCSRKVILSEDAISEEFIKFVLLQLSHYDPLLYAVSASIVSDLLLQERLTSESLDLPGIFKTAIKLLHDDNGAKWPESILAFLPVRNRGSYDELADRYKSRLLMELDAEKHEAFPEVTLGVLSTLGTCEKEELETMLIKVTEYYIFHRKDAADEELNRLKLLQEKILRFVNGDE